MWMQTAMPWVKPDEYEFASVDFTPNYLCHAGALHNINATARDPSDAAPRTDCGIVFKNDFVRSRRDIATSFSR